MNISTLNYLHGYLVENPIQTLIVRCHIVFLVRFTKRAWAACARACRGESWGENGRWAWVQLHGQVSCTQ